MPPTQAVREAVADLDALHGLDPHHCRREPRVEPVFPPGVGAEPRRNTARTYLDAAAEGVAISPRLVDGSGISSRLCERLPRHFDPYLAQERLRHRTGCDVRRRVPRRRPLS